MEAVCILADCPSLAAWMDWRSENHQLDEEERRRKEFDKFTHGLDLPLLMVNGIELLRPRPDEDGTYGFQNPFTGMIVIVKDEKVAAACEYIYGAAMIGKSAPYVNMLRQYVATHDPATYRDLIS